jgi:hypothetical protein
VTGDKLDGDARVQALCHFYRYMLRCFPNVLGLFFVIATVPTAPTRYQKASSVSDTPWLGYSIYRIGLQGYIPLAWYSLTTCALTPLAGKLSSTFPLR